MPCWTNGASASPAPPKALRQGGEEEMKFLTVSVVEKLVLCGDGIRAGREESGTHRVRVSSLFLTVLVTENKVTLRAQSFPASLTDS